MKPKLQDKTINTSLLLVKILFCMDIRKITFQDSFYNIVLHKGTLDCLFCVKSSTIQLHKALTYIYRELSPEGYYIYVFNKKEEHRIPFLEKYNKKIRFKKFINQFFPKC
jgi:hypothetical protein